MGSRPHFNGLQAKIIGHFDCKTKRFPINLTSNPAERGYVKIENLSPLPIQKRIKIKPRVNMARFFSNKLMKSQQNLCDSELMRDIKTFKEHCIYIRQFYDAQTSKIIFNKLQNELNEKIKNGAIVIQKKCQMVFYSKMTKKTKEKRPKLGANMFYNLYFSETFKKIIKDLEIYFDVCPYVVLLNYYKTASDVIPFHSDGLNHGHSNITIGVSFGYERNLTFRQNASWQTFDIPQKNGDLFAFTNRVNDKFKHALLEPLKNKQCVKPRFSVIIFGKRTKINQRNCADGEKMFAKK